MDQEKIFRNRPRRKEKNFRESIYIKKWFNSPGKYNTFKHSSPYNIASKYIKQKLKGPHGETEKSTTKVKHLYNSFSN